MNVPRILIALILAGSSLLGSARAASPAPADRRAVPIPVWRIWWVRNGPILRAGHGQITLLGADPAAWRRAIDISLVSNHNSDGELALLRLGLLADPSDLFDLLGAVRGAGRRGQAAVLGLGLFGEQAAVGHLCALFRDTVVGRSLAGNVNVPVPMSHRIAAAVALGLSGTPKAFQALRQGLENAHVPDALGAAMLVALSFSGTPSDGIRFEFCLRQRPERPLMREAAAAALGRHVARIPGARRLLVRALERDPEAGGRGAAVALWYEDAREDDTRECVALQKAALRSANELTGLLAMMTLAGRGHARVERVIDDLLTRDGPERGYAVLAAGLLGRAAPATRARNVARLQRMAPLEPRSVEVARRLLSRGDLRTRPTRGSSVAHVAGGNACFAGQRFLESVLDLTAQLAR